MLKCIINSNQIDVMKTAIKDIADEILLGKAKAGNIKRVTAREIYKYMNDNGLDVDLESIGFLYGEVFQNEIAKNANEYNTQEELDKLENVVMPLSKEVQNALMDAGYNRTTSDGEIVLDWYKLMQGKPLSSQEKNQIEEDVKNDTTIPDADKEKEVKKRIELSENNEDVMKAEIQKYVENEVNSDDKIPDTDKAKEIKDRVSKIEEAIANKWQSIIATAIAKKVNEKNRLNKKPQVNSSSSTVKKMAKAVSLGLTKQDDSYNIAMRKLLGISTSNLEVLSKLDELGRAMQDLSTSKYGDDNFLGVELEAKMNALLNAARYEEAGVLYKMASWFKGLMDMANLAILNNPANRLENYWSGLKESIFVRGRYGEAPEKIKQLKKSVKRDIVRRGATDFGGVTSQLMGDKRTSDIVRETIVPQSESKGSRMGNKLYNIVTGISALNGNDSAFKAQVTWVKFTDGLEKILISKENAKKRKDPNYTPLTPKEISLKLNEQLFGKKFPEYQAAAEKFMNKLNEGGQVIAVNKETIDRFAADIAKAELIQAQEIDLNLDEVDAAYRAAFTSGGMGLGHVPNNWVSSQLSKLKREQAERIERLIRDKEYNKAAGAIVLDAIVNRGLFRMIGGGMNWGVLKLQSGGLGITGLIPKFFTNKKDFDNLARLSEMTPKEIEDTLVYTNKINDRILRGSMGAVINTALLFIARAYIPDDDEEMWEDINEFLDEHRFVNRYLNKFLPLYVAGYMNHKLQEVQPKGYSQMTNEYAYNPMRNFASQLLMYREKNGIDEIKKGITNVMFKEATKNKTQQEVDIKAAAELSESIARLINLNPLPYKPFVDILDVYKTFVEGKSFEYGDNYDEENKDNINAVIDGIFTMPEEFNRKEKTK